MYNKFNYNQTRFPFAAPFLLGALTGGVAVGAFNPYRPRPIYYNYPEVYDAVTGWSLTKEGELAAFGRRSFFVRMAMESSDASSFWVMDSV